MEVFVGELPDFRESPVVQDAVVEMRDFMEAVHIELSDERVEVAMLEMVA